MFTIPSMRPSSSSEDCFTGDEATAAIVESGAAAAATTAGTSETIICDAAGSRISPSTTGRTSLTVSGRTSTFSGIVAATSRSATCSAIFSPPGAATVSTGTTLSGTSLSTTGMISFDKISGALAGATAATTGVSGTMAATTGATAATTAGFLVVSSSKNPAKNSSPRAAKVSESSESSASSSSSV